MRVLERVIVQNNSVCLKTLQQGSKTQKYPSPVLQARHA